MKDDLGVGALQLPDRGTRSLCLRQQRLLRTPETSLPLRGLPVTLVHEQIRLENVADLGSKVEEAGSHPEIRSIEDPAPGFMSHQAEVDNRDHDAAQD